MRYTFSKNQVLESKLMHPKDLSNGLPYIASIEKSLARRARYSNATNDSHLMDIKEQQVDLSQAFLDCIESVNAARLSRLCINSPSSEESLQSLRLRQDHCKNLRCLKLVVHRKNVKFFDQPDDFERNYTRWTRIKAIAKLDEVIVQFHSGSASAPAQDDMRRLGRKIVLGDTTEKYRASVELGAMAIIARTGSSTHCCSQRSVTATKCYL
jgi:hypothetical protein